MMYIVINADVKDSRIEGFSKAHFDKKIEQFNDEFVKEIIVPFSIIKGDELQGVITKDANVFKMIRLLRGIFSPYVLRIGVGVGSIFDDKEIDRVESSWVLNGPAFFNARDAIDIMKHNKGKKSITYYTFFNTNNELLDRRLNLLFSYVDEYLLNWTDELYDMAYYEERNFKHEDIALFLLKKSGNEITEDAIRKNRVNITKKILRSNWYKIKSTEELLLELFREGLK